VVTPAHHSLTPAAREGFWPALLWCLLGVLWPIPAAAVPGDAPGVLLVAAPGHGAPHFREAVLLLKRHAGGGTLGVILNRPGTTRVDDLFPDLPPPRGPAATVYEGGPAEADQVVFLVRTQRLAPRNALPVFDHVYLAYDLQLLADILRHPVPLPEVRVFRGHARWARGELEAAIARGEWYLVEADVDHLFASNPATLWSRLVRQVEAPRVRTPQ